jgi:hypothetical protein
MSNGRRTDIGCKSEESPTDGRRKSDESPIEIGRKSDGRRTKRTQPPLLRWQVAALHCNSWQRNATARPAECCNSLLWRGQQRVAVRCCGNGQQRCNSRRWAGSAATRGAGPAALQLAALGRQRCNLRQWPTACCNPGPTSFLFFLFFFTRQLQERKRERQKEKGRENL